MKTLLAWGVTRAHLLAGAALLAFMTPAAAQQKDAEPATRDANAALLKTLNLADTAAFDDAKRGFVASLPGGVVPGAGEAPAYSLKPYAFLDKSEAPATVNPSLWRQARLNAIHGLFKVVDRVYPVSYTHLDVYKRQK